MYSNVIFDLDGTLLDTIQDLAVSGNHTLQALGFPIHSVEDYKQMVGNGIPVLIRRMLPENHKGDAIQQIAQTIFDKHYAQNSNHFTMPYPGILELLDQLSSRQITLAVLSNKNDEYVRELCNHYFQNRIHFCMGLTEAYPPKPDPSSLLALLQHMNADPKHTLYVGDSDVDIQTARAAQLDSCGVCWGFRTKSQIQAANPTYLVETRKQLETVIIQERST